MIIAFVNDGSIFKVSDMVMRPCMVRSSLATCFPCMPSVRGWNRSLHIAYLTATHCLKKPNETSFEWQSAGQGQSSIGLEFDSVPLKKCLIFERSIVFDWQDVWVSSIMFDCRTQSKSIERLTIDWVRLLNVRLVTSGSTQLPLCTTSWDICTCFARFLYNN